MFFCRTSQDLFTRLFIEFFGPEPQNPEPFHSPFLSPEDDVSEPVESEEEAVAGGAQDEMVLGVATVLHRYGFVFQGSWGFLSGVHGCFYGFLRVLAEFPCGVSFSEFLQESFRADCVQSFERMNSPSPGLWGLFFFFGGGGGGGGFGV